MILSHANSKNTSRFAPSENNCPKGACTNTSSRPVSIYTVNR